MKTISTTLNTFGFHGHKIDAAAGEIEASLDSNFNVFLNTGSLFCPPCNAYEIVDHALFECPQSINIAAIFSSPLQVYAAIPLKRHTGHINFNTDNSNHSRFPYAKYNLTPLHIHVTYLRQCIYRHILIDFKDIWISYSDTNLIYLDMLIGVIQTPCIFIETLNVSHFVKLFR